MSVEAPHLVDIGRYDVTLQWETGRAVAGTVKYRTTGTEFTEASDEAVKTEHTLKIGGLQADTIYDYYLNDADDKHSFKTAPGKNTAFRFMVYQGEDLSGGGDWRNLERDFNANLPDFVVVLKSSQTRSDNQYKAKFLRQSDVGARALILYADETTGLKVFSYGNADLLCVNAKISGEELAERIETSQAKHLFIISTQNPNQQKDLEKIKEGVVFIYPGLDEGRDDPLRIALSEQVLILDVDGDGVVATRTALNDSTSEVITVKETPESVKRSCVYCRKLLEAKKYQDSIDWYRDFIAKYRTKYIVDDAQFQIANIYDHYLYDYSKALAEYALLIDTFPDSTKVEQARQRIEYINSYSDYGFAPLASFEQTKSEVYKNDKLQAIRAIEEVVEKYPDAKILNKMLFWLGHALAQEDLEKSIFYHDKLLLHSSGREKKETLISKGDVYYAHKQYRNAMAAYGEALITGEAKYNFGVQDKIDKSLRNITRGHISTVAWIILGIACLGAVFIKPLFFTKAEILRVCVLVLILFSSAYGVWWWFYKNYPEVAAFIPALFLMLGSSHLIAAAYSRKVFSKRPGLVNLLLTTLGFLLLNVLLYYVFLYQYHYLPSLGL